MPTYLKPRPPTLPSTEAYLTRWKPCSPLTTVAYLRGSECWSSPWRPASGGWPTWPLPQPRCLLLPQPRCLLLPQPRGLSSRPGRRQSPGAGPSPVGSTSRSRPPSRPDTPSPGSPETLQGEGEQRTERDAYVFVIIFSCFIVEWDREEGMGDRGEDMQENRNIYSFRYIYIFFSLFFLYWQYCSWKFQELKICYCYMILLLSCSITINIVGTYN